MSEKYTPSSEEIKLAEESMSRNQTWDSESREHKINYWENRPTLETLETEFQALLQQIDSFKSKVAGRSFSGEDRQQRFKDEAGIDPEEVKEYYAQLRKMRGDFIQQLDWRARDTKFVDSMDDMPGH